MESSEECLSFDGEGESGSGPSYQLFSHLINGWATVFWVLIGCMGNIYSVYLINWHIRLQTSVSLHMSVLAGWDTSLLGAVFFYYSFAAIWQELEFYPAYQYIAWLIHPISSTTMTSSLWMIVLITTERHFSIWRPLAFKIKDTMTRARIICLAVGVSAVIFNLPNFLELKVIHCPCVSNSTIQNDSVGTAECHTTKFVPTGMRKSPIYNFVYRVFFMSLFTSILPFFYILVLTVRMILFVHRASKQLDAITLTTSKGAKKKRQSSERLVTKVLLVVTLKFLLCHTLPTFLNVWESLMFLKGKAPEDMGLLFVYLVDLSNLLVVFNSATNSAIYFLCRKRMRRARNISRLKATVIVAVAFTRFLRNQREEKKALKMPLEAFQKRTPCNTASLPHSPSQLSSNLHSKGLISAIMEMRSKGSDECEDAHFTGIEAEYLKESWSFMSDRGISEKFFGTLASESLFIASEFIPYKFFVHEELVGEGTQDTDSLLISNLCESITPAKQIERMFQTIVDAAGNPEEEEIVGNKLQQIGRSHFHSGIILRNQLWHDLRQLTISIAKEVARKNLSNPELLMDEINAKQRALKIEDAWKRVICFVISKIKRGRLLAEINGPSSCGDVSIA